MDWQPIQELVREAASHDERRLLVLAGESGHSEAVRGALEAADAALGDGSIFDDSTVVGPPSGLPCDHLAPDDVGQLLGTTRTAVVLDCRAACRPNDLGQVVGAVDGGGLLVLLTPPLGDWPSRRDEFDETLAVPPDTVDAVTGHFRDRLVETLTVHRGVAIVDLDADEFVRDGLTGQAPRRDPPPIETPAGTEAIPDPLFESCLTQDQADALADLAALATGPTAAVLEADRGRGKSSVAGLLAAWFVARGERVVVTGPSRWAATAFFERILEVLPPLDGVRSVDGSPPNRIVAASGGEIEFVAAQEMESKLELAAVLFVEEAAALPVALLESTLSVPRVAYTTTVHGYEGSGRGFAVRFRDSLAAARHDVLDITLAEPIRYAGGDPVEVWAARALLLDASPVPGSLIEDARPETVRYLGLDSETLRRDEQLLREVFGLLVTAHYRTEPADLARLLDGSNLAVRALLRDGHVVAVALIAREGGLPPETLERVSLGERIRGNMLPDVLMSQLRDEDAGRLVGIRVVRIATHHAVRSRGLGSYLLSNVEDEFGPVVDWIGTGFGATPKLVSFWQANGYEPIHLSTSRNERSGEHSVLMLKPTADPGNVLADAHGRWFGTRIGGVLQDSLEDLDPDVIRAVLDAGTHPPSLAFSPHRWRVIAGAAFGPGLYSVDPEPFRTLSLHGLVDGAVDLSDREERLLVRGLLQGHSWDRVADELDFVSGTAAMRAFGRALQPLVEEYGPEALDTYRTRFESA
ncbi:MAG: tRNA(Met) cytidine acetyltransferase TmcA [Halodesulfurarchaeum sp.]|nr:tRNA(Met) cytidine acetyltransferase TmcA [Halodesulfurarchaeum sp.]